MTEHCPWCGSETLSNLERHYFACYSFVADGFRRQSLRCKLTCTESELKHARELLQTVVEIHAAQVANLAAKSVVYLPDLWYSAAINLIDKEGNDDDGNMPMRPDNQSGIWRTV